MLQQFKERIKGLETEIFIVFTMLLLAITIAGAVRLFTVYREKGGPVFQENAFSVFSSGTTELQRFVASKNGTKFYPAECKSAERIKPENRIFFATALEAQKAGFEATSQCSSSKP